jgi:hypothetical protein
MPVPPYITPDDVRTFTGVQPSQLDLEPSEGQSADEALAEKLEGWISHAQDLVTRFVRVQYDPSAPADDLGADPAPMLARTVPDGLKNAVLRVVANMVAQAKLRRATNVMQVGEYEQRLVDDRVFTRAIKDDLLLYQREEPTIGGARPWVGSIGVTGMSGMADEYAHHPDTFGDWTKMRLRHSTLRDVLACWRSRI